MAKDLAQHADQLVRWILENVDETVVPADELNDGALVYNLVHLALHGPGYEKYDYKPDQNEWIEKNYRAPTKDSAQHND